MLNKLVLKLTIFVFIFSSNLFAQDKETISLQLKWFSSFEFAGYYMAKEKGFYKEHGLDVKIKQKQSSSSNTKQSLLVDAQYGVEDASLFLHRAKGEPIKILASIFQYSPLIFISNKEGININKYKETNLLYKEGLDNAVLYLMNENRSISLNNLSLITDSKNILNYGINFYADNLFTTEDELLHHPQRVQNFVKASLMGWEYAMNNKEETIRILREKYNVKNSFEKMLQEANVIENMMLRDIIKLGYTSLDRFKNVAQNYVNSGKVTSSDAIITLNSLIYTPKTRETDYANYLKVLAVLFLIFGLATTIFAYKVRDLKVKIKSNNETIENYKDTIDSHIIMSTTDLLGNITSVSKAFCELTGFSKEELIGKKHNIIRHPDMPYDFYKSIWDAITQNDFWEGELKNMRKNGEPYWVYLNIEPMYDEREEKIGYKAYRKDITDKKLIDEVSIKDGLTNIYNRRHFNEIFPKFINSAKRHNEMICFLIMDLDFFKEFNDSYGHAKGDDVLIEVASLFKEMLHRSDDYGFRLSGEEFGVLYKANSKDAAIHFADELRLGVKRLKIFHERNRASKYLTASVGLFCVPANEVESRELVYKKADLLLCQAKEQGRNQLLHN